MLVLVCLAVVHRLRPEWICITLDAAARSEKLSPQRLSRLCTKSLSLFQEALESLTRIGRPIRVNNESDTAQKTALLRELLDVAISILKHVSLRKPAVRALIVGAFLRLKRAYPELTRRHFCETLNLSCRTFRHWMTTQNKSPNTSPVSPPPKKKKPPKRAPRRPRFGFQLVLPDTQIAADTTDIKACGVSLKLIAAQDIGDRHQNLLDSIIVDDHENADLVVKAITEAIDNKPGQQVLTDQGTPYMAEATRIALEQLEAEHAPQKEGHPQGKATVERAFGTVKQIAQPLLNLTNRIAEIVPALHNLQLAKAVATLVLTAVLKAYQSGARAAVRADNARAEISADELADLAEQSRENARAEARSARLLLSAIHHDYNIQQPLNAFIRAMRRFPMVVLKQAESDFSMQAHRDNIKDRAAYFAAIARRRNEPYQQRLAAQRKQREDDLNRERHNQKIQAMHDAWKEAPDTWLCDAFLNLAQQWDPIRRNLLFGGTGPALIWINNAVVKLMELHGTTSAVDIANATFANFELTAKQDIGPDGIQRIYKLLQNAILKHSKTQTDCNNTLSSIILQNNGP